MWYKLLKLFLVVAVLLFVFCAGAASVVRMTRGPFSAQWKPGAMMSGQYGNSMFYGGSTMMGWGGNRGMMTTYDRQATQQSWQRLFGTISKIEGNKITITDNAAMEGVVLSQQSTVIVANGVEAGLASLKAGQNVVVVYSLNQEKQMVAATISVQ
jgi:hypothetical protein